jgi:pyruvate dehydrogenase E1 component
MAEDRRDVGLLAITSADRLYAEWTAAQRTRESGLVHSRSHIERLLAGWVPRRASYEIPRHFGRTGPLVDLYRHYGIGAYAIVTAAQSSAI